ncbi:hypothetical protein SASPL_114991 [Salvia splendens]|uniref:Uncharacterized protein n=1 Tax=Salvia splendens TaxID=180675 RepID=A0A8X9A177_SALSN|nr:hypothetical protein SASPL_114991 [Salvia splendens]
MVQLGKESPVKEAKDTYLSPSMKWVFRPPNARRKMKKSATPHPEKVGDNAKRYASVSLMETGRARKKIVFELEEFAAGINGGIVIHAGEEKVWLGTSRKLWPEPSRQPSPNLGWRSMCMAVAARVAAMDVDTPPNGNGASMLSEPSILAATFTEKPSCVLASETCDLHLGKPNLEFKSDAGTPTKEEEANVDGEVELGGKPPASTQPDELTLVEGSVAAPFGMPPAPDPAPELAANQPAEAETHPYEPALHGKSEDPSVELESGGEPKLATVTLDTGHDMEIGTAGSWVHKASYLEKLLKGNNVATVLFEKANAEVIDSGGTLTNFT